MVLHLPMRLLSTIRQRAAPAIDATNNSSSSSGPGRDVSTGAGALAATGSSSGADGGLSAGVFAQLLLDMHRHVGVVLLDRMGHGEACCLAQHLQVAAKVRSEHLQAAGMAADVLL